MAALSFANESEAAAFRMAVEEKLKLRAQKKNGKDGVVNCGLKSVTHVLSSFLERRRQGTVGNHGGHSVVPGMSDVLQLTPFT